MRGKALGRGCAVVLEAGAECPESLLGDARERDGVVLVAQLSGEPPGELAVRLRRRLDEFTRDRIVVRCAALVCAVDRTGLTEQRLALGRGLVSIVPHRGVCRLILACCGGGSVAVHDLLGVAGELLYERVHPRLQIDVLVLQPQPAKAGSRGSGRAAA